MPSTPSLLDRLKIDFPELTFSPSTIFKWSPETKTIYYTNTSDPSSLLHEVAHAALCHESYKYDIELLKMERQAWEYALDTLAKKYDVEISQDQTENMLDSYRDWLHSRSLCPNCQATGIQTDTSHYTCIACTNIWRVNEARACALRRYKT